MLSLTLIEIWIDWPFDLAFYNNKQTSRGIKDPTKGLAVQFDSLMGRKEKKKRGTQTERDRERESKRKRLSYCVQMNNA